MRYPARKKITADVLAPDGAVCIGCYKREGEIIPALSPFKVKEGCPENVTFAYREKANGRIIALAEGKLYTEGAEGFYARLESFPASRPFVFHSEDGTAYIAGDGVCARTQYITAEPYNFGIFGGVTKNGRLFAIDKEDNFKIRWSGEGGGLDTAEGVYGAGWVNVNPERGKILGLAVFKQKIAVVCEYGIALLNAFGTPENFKLQYIDGATGKIYAGTAQVAGNKLVFLTENGFACFDGVKVEKPRPEIEKDIINPSFSASADGIYFVCAESKALERRVVFAVEPVDWCGYIVDLPATAGYTDGNLFLFSVGALYELKAGGEFAFTSGAVNFGARGIKTVASVFLGNEKPATVEVCADGKTRIVRGVTGYCLPCVSGRSFKITVRAQEKIHGVCAVAEAVDGV